MTRCSVVVPVRDEAASLEELLRALGAVMDAVDPAHEILVVDDGSEDGTRESFLRLAPPRARLLRSPGRGKADALQAGFDAARGEVIVTLDGDLQDDPADIPRLLGKLDEGHDLVVGWRRRRQDPLSKRLASRAANLLRRLLLGERVHDVGCPLRVFRRSLLSSIRLRGGLHRWLTALAARRGFKVAELEVSHRARRHGRSKYGNWGRALEAPADLLRVLAIR